jgi:hypothetical protein
MNVAYIYPASAATDEQYETIARRVLGNGKPAGLVFHVAGRDQGGQMRVFEVWESEKAHDRFGEQTLFPIFKEYGIDVTQGPEPVRVEVQNLVR